MTFATNTLNNSNSAISDIEQAIAKLQKQLTELQEQQQAIKSAEQQGCSAISQYKQAIATIAALNEPEMLQEFLREMATITAMAVEPETLQQGDDSPEDQPTISDEPDSPNDDPAKSTAITSRKRKLSDVIVEAVNEGLDNQCAWNEDDKTKVMRYKKALITEFCDEHGVTLPKGNPTKKIICSVIARAGFTAENVCQWLERN